MVDEMKMVIKPRGGGKTTDLIKMAHKRHGYIVCRTSTEASRIHKEAWKMGLNIMFPITYQEFMSVDYRGSNIKEFYIDDAQALLQQFTPVHIHAITLNRDPE